MKTVGELSGWEFQRDLLATWKHHFPHADPVDQPHVEFFRQGNFTICEVYAAPDLRAFGVTKRAASFDRNKPKVARLASFGRACKALVREMAKERKAQVAMVLRSMTGAST